MDSDFEEYLRARSEHSKSVALGKLMKCAEPFISRIVHHFSSGSIKDIESEERLQTARIGFLEAVRRCDPSKGPLRPYAIKRIRHELQSMAELNYAIKIPRRSGLPATLLRDIERIRAKEGREPTREELNGHAAIYDEASLRPRVVTSFDADDVDGFTGLKDSFSSEDPSALDLILEKEMQSNLRASRAADVIGSALKRPASMRPLNKRKPIMSETTKNPIEALTAALTGLAQHLQTLDQQEAAIKKEREEIKSAFSKAATVVGGMNPVPTHANGNGAHVKPILALNQNKLPHRIISYLKENQAAKVSVIAAAVGDSSKNTGEALQKLRSSNVVTAAGKARGMTYSLNIAQQQ